MVSQDGGIERRDGISSTVLGSRDCTVCITANGLAGTDASANSCNLVRVLYIRVRIVNILARGQMTLHCSKIRPDGKAERFVLVQQTLWKTVDARLSAREGREERRWKMRSDVRIRVLQAISLA